MAAPDIPKKQKAAIYDNPGSVSTKIVELDVPEPSDNEVLINLYVKPSKELLQHLKSLNVDLGVIQANANVFCVALTLACATRIWVL